MWGHHAEGLARRLDSRKDGLAGSLGKPAPEPNFLAEPP